MSKSPKKPTIEEEEQPLPPPIQAQLTAAERLLVTNMQKEMGVSATAVVRMAVRLLHFVRAHRWQGFVMLLRRGAEEVPITPLDDIVTTSEATYLNKPRAA